MAPGSMEQEPLQAAWWEGCQEVKTPGDVMSCKVEGAPTKEGFE